MDGHGNGDDKEEPPKLPPITIVEDDQREYENRYRAWDMVIKTAASIEKISCDAQRKNTSSNEAELVCKLSNVIISLCKEHLLPIIPPLMASPPDALSGLSMAADLHHTNKASYYKIPELVNPKFIQEQSANALDQPVVMNPKKSGTRPRTNPKFSKGDNIQLGSNKNSPKPLVISESSMVLSMQRHRTFKHKQNTLNMLRNVSPMLPIPKPPPQTSHSLSSSFPLPPLPQQAPPPSQPPASSALPLSGSSSSLSFSSSPTISSKFPLSSSSLAINSEALLLQLSKNCESLENKEIPRRLQSKNDIPISAANISILSRTMDTDTKASCFIAPNNTDFIHLQKQSQNPRINEKVKEKREPTDLNQK